MHDVGVAMAEAQIEAYLEDHTSGVLAYGGTAAEEPPIAWRWRMATTAGTTPS